MTKEYQRLNYTHKDLMAFQNNINLTDNEKFIVLATQLLEYQSTDPHYFNILYSLGSLVFKFPDAKIRSLENRVLSEKLHFREVLFEANLDGEIYGKYQTWKNQLTNREKYIIFSFCLAELGITISESTINNYEFQVQSILNISKKLHKELHKDINKLNYLSKIIHYKFR